MARKVNAMYDGKVVHPDEPLHLPANSRLVITYEPIEEIGEKDRPPPVSFFDVARANPIKGPPDWSERLDYYLYGNLPEVED